MLRIRANKVTLMMTTIRRCGLASALLLVTSACMSQAPTQSQEKPLSAEASDPVEMGWMQGFPPSDDHTLSAADGSFFKFPALRWSVVHMRQFLPTVNVSRGLGAPVSFEHELDAGIDAIEFTPRGSDEPMTWEASLQENYTDGILILHHGQPVYERYFGEMQPDRKHAAMSVTKSFTGTLAATLVAEGKLDRDAAVTDYVPELEDSAFGDATVGEVMNMTTCLDYSEDYADPQAQIWDYAKASNPLPRADNDNGPTGTFDYLQTLEAKEECTPGNAFAYKTPNADALGWIVARASDQSLAELLSQKIWSRLGMEQSAYYQVDANGMPAAGGGLSAGLRDMGRFGQMMLNDGVWRGEQILPEDAIADIREGGSQEAFARSDHPGLKGWSYKDMWWIMHNDHGAYAARGVHGQTIYIDPAADMVIVRFASHPVAANAANDATSLPAYQAVADYLMAHDTTAELVGDAWVIETIAGRGVIDNSPARLEFLDNGRLVGNASCNQLMGDYERTDGGLSIEPAGTTMKACPEALMNQERRLLDLLPQITGYRIDSTGALILQTDEGESITAYRQ